jgi:Flp pilus assembly protein TadD
MNPDVHYLHGVAELESGNAIAAIECLRRVLYLDPSYSLAAFALGRAHEFTGELDAARRRYEQALRMLAAETGDAERIGGSIDPATVADACQARLSVLPGISAATEAAR